MKYYIKIALQHLAMGIIIPVSVIWKMQNGLTVGEAILTESIILLATALADLPAGFITSAINNRRALILGALLHVIGLALLVIGGSLLIFILAAIITGVAWAFTSGADEAYLHDDFIDDKKKYRKYFATVTIVDEAFTIIGMLATSLLVYLGFGLQVLFFAATTILLAHLLYTFFVLPKSHMQPSPNQGKRFKLLSLKVIQDRKLLALLPLMIAFGVIYEAGRPLWQPHMQTIGIDLAAFGVIFALLKLASIGGSVLSHVREFAIKDLVIIFSIMLGALLLFGTSFAAISIIALCAYLFTENYFRVYMSSVLNERIVHNRAAILSIASVTRNGAGALIIAGLSVISDISIMIALVCLVLIKVPVIIYVLSNAKQFTPVKTDPMNTIVK